MTEDELTSVIASITANESRFGSLLSKVVDIFDLRYEERVDSATVDFFGQISAGAEVPEMMFSSKHDHDGRRFLLRHKKGQVLGHGVWNPRLQELELDLPVSKAKYAVTVPHDMQIVLL